MTQPEKAEALAAWLRGEARHSRTIAARYKAASKFHEIYTGRAEKFDAAAEAIASLTEAPAVPVGETEHVVGRAASVICEVGALCGWPGPECKSEEAAQALFAAGLLAGPPVKAAAVDGPNLNGIRDCLEAIEYASGNCIKEHGQKTVNELAKVALSYLDVAALAPQPAVEGEAVAYWAVFSKSGVHIGLWESEAISRDILREYEGGSIIPLFLRPAAADAGVREALAKAAQAVCDRHDEATVKEVGAGGSYMSIQAKELTALENAVRELRAAISLAAKRGQ